MAENFCFWKNHVDFKVVQISANLTILDIRANLLGELGLSRNTTISVNPNIKVNDVQDGTTLQKILTTIVF